MPDFPVKLNKTVSLFSVCSFSPEEKEPKVQETPRPFGQGFQGRTSEGRSNTYYLSAFFRT